MPRGEGRQYGNSRKNQGFTLFEMVVVICSIVILYMVAEQRMNELPAAAERANFFAVLEQIKTGMNLEMITRVTSGNSWNTNDMVGTNPMRFLLDQPRNYRGELEEVTDRNSTRRSWYFETSTGQLVYVVGGPSIEDVRVTIASIPVNLGQIRFRLENVFDEPGGEGNSRSWQGLQLQPVRPYEWERRQETPVEL